jgi:hypothetical protein
MMGNSTEVEGEKKRKLKSLRLLKYFLIPFSHFTVIWVRRSEESEIKVLTADIKLD